MNVKCGDRVLVTGCRGCMCHDMAVTFGDGGNCDECGCPTTKEAFDRMWNTRQHVTEHVRMNVGYKHQYESPDPRGLL